jgi:hypothetical protein
MSADSTNPPMSSGDAMSERFKALSALDQAHELNKLTTIHTKTVKAQLKAPKKKEKDPDAPKKVQGPNVQKWYDDLEKIQQEYGIKTDEKGNPIYKIDKKTGESKPDYNVSYKEAMKLASKRRKDEAGTEDVVPANKATKAKAVAVTEPPKTAAKAVSKTVPTAPKVSDDNEYVSEEPRVIVIKGETLLKYDNGDTWYKNPDNTRGEWKGVYNPQKKRFENTAPEYEPDY